MAREHALWRSEIVETRRVVVSYRQSCVRCGKRFETKTPAETCSDHGKQIRKRESR